MRQEKSRSARARRQSLRVAKMLLLQNSFKALLRSAPPLSLSLSLSLPFPTEQNRATGGRPLKCMRRGGGVGSEARLPLQIAYCCEERDEGEIKRGGGRENCERSKFPSKEVKEGRPPARARPTGFIRRNQP